MLIIKEQIKLKSLKGIQLTPNVLCDKIGVFYGVMNLQITAEDFLHLLNRPPEIYLAEGEMLHLTLNNYTNNQNLKMEFINQLINRILLLGNQTLSYQDSIYVTSMLEKIGVKHIGELLSHIRRTLRENQTIKRLTDMYRENGAVIRQAIKIEKNRLSTDLSGQYTEQNGGMHEHKHERKELNSNLPEKLFRQTNGIYRYENRDTIQKEEMKSDSSEYYLHSHIYQRLQTAAVYKEVYEQVRQYGAALQNIQSQELNMAEQVRVSDVLLLSRLRNEYTFQETNGTEIYINQYETGIAGEKTITRENILSEILSAVFISLANNIYQIRREQMEQRNIPQFRIVQSLCHCMDNTLKRYETYHTRGIRQLAENYVFIEDSYRLSDYEINILENIVGNAEITGINFETMQSGWQQELIYYFGQNDEYNLSETVSKVLTEYCQRVQNINYKTGQNKRYQIKQTKQDLPKQIQYDFVKQTENHFHEKKENKIQEKEKYYLSEQIRYGLTKQIKQYLTFPRKLQLIRQALKENVTSFDKEFEYQNIIREIQSKSKKEEYISEEKQEIINTLATQVLYEIVNNTMTDIFRERFRHQEVLVKELLKVQEYSELLKEIGSAVNSYEFWKLKESNGISKEVESIASVAQENIRRYKRISSAEYNGLRQKLNLTHSIYQIFNDKDTNISLQIKKFQEIKAEKEDAAIQNGILDSLSIWHTENNEQRKLLLDIIDKEQDNNVYIKEKTIRELQQIIQNENQVLQSSHDGYEEKTKEIYDNFAEYGDMQIQEAIEIQNQWQNQKVLQQLQEINKKNIEMNQKYRQQMKEQHTSFSALQVDGRKTINEALKVMNNQGEYSVENTEVIYNNQQPWKIDETVRKLASKETIKIFETILGEPSENIKELEYRDSQTLLNEAAEQEKQSIIIHKVSEEVLKSEIREIEHQMEQQQQTQIQGQSIPLARNQKKNRIDEESGDRRSEIQKTIDTMNLIHKDQRNLPDEEILEYLRQYRQSESRQKNDFKQTVENNIVETKEINQKKNEVVTRSKEGVEELVQRNLQRQMETITDRVFHRIEKKLQMERRRRGY